MRATFLCFRMSSDQMYQLFDEPKTATFVLKIGLERVFLMEMNKDTHN